MTYDPTKNTRFEIGRIPGINENPKLKPLRIKVSNDSIKVSDFLTIPGFVQEHESVLEGRINVETFHMPWPDISLEQQVDERDIRAVTKLFLMSTFIQACSAYLRIKQKSVGPGEFTLEFGSSLDLAPTASWLCADRVPMAQGPITYRTVFFEFKGDSLIFYQRLDPATVSKALTAMIPAALH